MGLLLFAVVLGTSDTIVVDDVMSAALAFLVAATVSTAFAFTRYNLGIADGAGVVAFLVRWIAYFGWYPFVVWCLTPDESRDAWRYHRTSAPGFRRRWDCPVGFLPGFAQMVHDGGDLPTWDIQGRRLVSSILDPNFAGMLIVIALLFRFARVAEAFARVAV